jgi:iron complex outermembrane recepter protein
MVNLNCQHSIRKTALALFILFLTASVSQGQTKQLLTWRSDLTYLQTIPKEELQSQREAVSQIRTGIEFWLKLHPSAGIELKSAPPQPWNAGQVSEQVAQLRETIDAIIKEDPQRPFELGVTLVSVTAEASPLSPVTDSIDHSQIENFHSTSVAQAIQYIPGLAIDKKASRNQAGVMIRGFDTRQVGLYLDNVPIYVPYDGYADISRFLTSDIAEIEVAKGYSSPLLGPNGLGGAVNLVSRQPEKKLEGDASIGTGSGDMLESGFHIGSRWNHFFLRGGMDWLQTNYYPISGDFTLNTNQPNYHRANSYQRDARYNGRIGWTPREQDQYVFTYSNQKADYASPPYSGNDPTNKVNYWQWPVWNRDSYYFNSNTGLGESSSIKFRIFYDHYPNRMNQFTSLTYSTLSSVSAYDDHSDGASAEFSTRILAKHTIGASFFFKDDTHRENGLSISNGVGTIQPWRAHRDQMTSIGLQDSISFTAKLHATVGLSADHMNAMTALDLKTITTTTGSGKNKVTTTTYSIAGFECNASKAGASLSSCLLHVWDFNPLASLSYSLSKSGSIFLTFAEKSHFPTLKDRYSYKNGQAIPNPTLQPEHARNWDLGYSHVFPFSTMVQLEVFRSDVYDAIENTTIAAAFSNQCPSLPAGVCQQSVNVGKEVHQGAEFTIRSTPLSRLTLDVNYTFLNRTISGPSNMPAVYPTGTPKHRAIGTASLRLPHQIKLLASARYDSGTFTTNNSGIPVPASKFATADLGGIVPVVSGMSLQLGIKNLFDRNYYFQEGFPESGRNYYLNMRYRF